MMRSLLWPLNPLYAAAVAAKNIAYDRAWRQTQHLQWPVISIGNISVGGSGKTPLVIRLAELLKQNGLHVDVLSRGYGRSSYAMERVDPAGSPDRFGDEPLLIAQSANVPVYVGASRYAAGLLAEKEYTGAGIHLLDDGFQHRQLARSLDIVIIHRTDFAETLLPSGNLREPFSSLKRASILALRSEDADLEAQLQRQGITAPLWWIDRTVQVPNMAGRAVVFCGIARPQEFFAALKSNGVESAAMHAFRDHHRYTEADMRQLIEMARLGRADSFLTTEKDLARLNPAQRALLTAVAPLRTVKLDVRLRDEAAIVERLSEQLSSRLSIRSQHSM